MAGNILAGFVKGFSGVALDQMERREQANAEMRKAEMLERLRRETAQEVALLQDRLDSSKADNKLSTDDYSTGTRTLRNSKGEVIGSHALDPSVIEERELGLEDARLGLDVKRANINQSNAAAETSRAYAERARSLDSSGGKRKGGEGKMLVAEYERAFEELQESGANPAVLANFQTSFHEGVTEKNWNEAQQRKFLNQMRSTFTRSWTDLEGRERRPLSESFSSANSILDSKL